MIVSSPLLTEEETAYILPRGDFRPGHFSPLAFDIVIRSPTGQRTIRIAPDRFSDWVYSQGPQHRHRLGAIHDHLESPPASYLGLSLFTPLIMGVVNVTPDSFSDGGDTPDPDTAVAKGRAMVEAGANILDVGGESTRPGSDPVSIDAEIARVVPVIEGLRSLGAPISVDTRNAPVMEAAQRAGAQCINDVTALTGDSQALTVAARSGLPVMLMHMQGEPRSMQAAPVYDDALLDVYDYLEARVNACLEAGTPRANIAIDPGIGFGKNDDHNLRLIGGLAMLRGLGCPVVLGVSRKSMIGRLAGIENPKDRLPGSLAMALAGLSQGANIIRVHDVAETVQAAKLWQALPPLQADQGNLAAGIGRQPPA